jgi:hypothetical protein
MPRIFESGSVRVLPQKPHRPVSRPKSTRHWSVNSNTSSMSDCLPYSVLSMCSRNSAQVMPLDAA